MDGHLYTKYFCGIDITTTVYMDCKCIEAHYLKQK